MAGAMAFPIVRPRRLRVTAPLRALVRETALSPRNFIWPVFFNAAIDAPNPIRTMPGVSQLPLRAAAQTAKDAVPDLCVMTDVCVDEYTDHGHCGVLKTDARGVTDVDNDATLDILARAAVVYAKAGADVVAPSDMMDGRVGALRRALDGEGLVDTAILSYAVKYASSFYGPFREAAECAPKFGDRAGYQMDPANAREALREARLDEEEGADMLMVKPGLPYLDVIAKVRAASPLPLGAYNVSGEYAMIKAASAAGMIDERRAVLELLTSIRRAGADFVLTYHAVDAARWLG